MVCSPYDFCRLMGVARDNIEAALIATGPAEKIAPQVRDREIDILCSKFFEYFFFLKKENHYYI